MDSALLCRIPSAWIGRRRVPLRRTTRSREGAQFRRWPTRITLPQEEFAAFGFIVFANSGRLSSKSSERTEETTVAHVGPTDVSRSAPTVGPQRIESSVIADAVIGISLNRLFGVITQSRPCAAPARLRGDDESKCDEPVVSTQRKRLFKSSPRRLWLIGKDGRGRTAGGQIHRPGVSHGVRLGHAVRGPAAVSRDRIPAANSYGLARSPTSGNPDDPDVVCDSAVVEA